jgi:hypothetical protein
MFLPSPGLRAPFNPEEPETDPRGAPRVETETEEGLLEDLLVLHRTPLRGEVDHHLILVAEDLHPRHHPKMTMGIHPTTEAGGNPRTTPPVVVAVVATMMEMGGMEVTRTQDRGDDQPARLDNPRWTPCSLLSRKPPCRIFKPRMR